MNRGNPSRHALHRSHCRSNVSLCCWDMSVNIEMIATGAICSSSVMPAAEGAKAPQMLLAVFGLGCMVQFQSQATEATI